MKKKIKRKVIHIAGGFDPYHRPEIFTFLEKLVDENDGEEIVLDLKDLNYLHFKAGVALQQIKKKLFSKGKKLSLINVSPYFLHLLNLSGHDWRYDILDKKIKRRKKTNFVK